MSDRNKLRMRWAMFQNWNVSKDKTSFRNQFYEGHNNLHTPVIEFGSKIARLNETDPTNILVRDIPKYEYSEYPLIANFGGFMVESHPDAFEMETLGIADHKTSSIRDKKIRARLVIDGDIRYYVPCDDGDEEVLVGWTRAKLAGWEQTPFYSVLTRKIWGTYNPITHIIEVPTEKIETKGRYGVNDYYDRKKRPDGSYEPCIMHERIVTDKELDVMEARIVKTFKEIEQDYCDWLIS